MGETAGGIIPADCTEPKPQTRPRTSRKTQTKTPHQLRLERLFEWAVEASIAGKPPAFHDATLSAIDVTNALITWKLTVPGSMQRVAAARLITGTPIKDIAAAEKVTVEVARHNLACAMTSFEAIIAKLEGPDLTLDEKSYVPVMRRVTGERNAAAPFMMRKANAEIERLLAPEMQDACCEIEFAFRYLAGELCATTNLRAYGILPGKASREHLEDKAMQLVPRYSQWQRALLRSSPEALVVVRAIVLDGCGLRQAAVRARLVDPRAAAKLLVSGLNEYCIRAGWGDVIGAYKQHDPGFVYVIAAGEEGPFKIGYSKAPKARLHALQVASPHKLGILFLMKTGPLASKDTESEICDHLKADRLRGDWYGTELTTIIELLRIIHPAGADVGSEHFARS